MTDIEQIVFDRYKAGDTHGVIAKKLNDAGHRTATGKNFSDPGVSAVVGKLGIADRAKKRLAKRYVSPPPFFMSDTKNYSVGFTSNIPVDIDSDFEDNMGFPHAAYRGPS